MTSFKTHLCRALFLSSIVFVPLTASSALAQTPSGVLPGGEGLFSYIFSFKAVTVALVMMLVAQIVFRSHRRHANKIEAVKHKQHIAPKRKKRYDRAEMSSLLKASASGTKSPVLLAQSSDSMAAGNLKQAGQSPLAGEPAPAAPRQAEIAEETPQIAEESAIASSQSQPPVEAEGSENLI
jgi:hypothetical protein